MKLIDKIKNYFCDEEDEDASKKGTLPKPEQPAVKAKPEGREEKKENNDPKNVNVDAISERELFKSDPTFNFPIIFDDDDFKEEKISTSRVNSVNNNSHVSSINNNSRINSVKVEQNKVVESVERKLFKPSPIISPIYGVIDLDAKEKSSASNGDVSNLLNLYEENKKIDIDDVLGKVYEQTRVETKRENYTKTVTVSDPVVVPKEDLAFDFFNNISSEIKEDRNTKIEAVDSISNADEKLKTIDELLENTDDGDFYTLVDSMYKDDDEEGVN